MHDNTFDMMWVVESLKLKILKVQRSLKQLCPTDLKGPSPPPPLKAEDSRR